MGQLLIGGFKTVNLVKVQKLLRLAAQGFLFIKKLVATGDECMLAMGTTLKANLGGMM